MATAPKPYSRLTRNASGIGSYASLWLGDDHLMIVTSTGYSERYARLQFRDIKGFFVTASERRYIWGAVWGIVTAIWVTVVIVQLVNRNTPVFSAIFLGLSAIMVVWNHVLGPGCHLFAVTGVQTVQLPSVVRLKKARRLLGRVQPLIEAAQADLVVAPVAVAEPPPLNAPPLIAPAESSPGAGEPPAAPPPLG